MNKYTTIKHIVELAYLFANSIPEHKPKVFQELSELIAKIDFKGESLGKSKEYLYNIENNTQSAKESFLGLIILVQHSSVLHD